MARYGKFVFKLLELLVNDFYLALPRSREEKRKFHLESERIWREIDRKCLFSVLRRLRLEGAVNSIQEKDNLERIIITDKGKARFLEYQFSNLKLKKSKKWDGRWRIVLFDVPEIKKKIRDALRRKLKTLGFVEFQKSVFIHPYSCEDEVNFVINFFGIYENVYYIESTITPDDKFRKHFRL